MPTINARVDVTNYFPQIRKAHSDLARRAVGEAAKVGGAKAASIAATRSGPSGDMADIRVSSPIGTADGWQASFLSPVYYAWYQNWGTLGNRKRALRGTPRTDRPRTPGTGIKPLYFLDAGKRVGKAHMKAVLRKGI